MLTQQELKKHLHYEPLTGLFTWIKPKKHGTNIGDVVGTKHKDGYLTLELNDKGYLLHRLAFLYMTSDFPANKVDHINGIRNDNRWKNLRHATNLQNCQNRKTPSNNRSGYIGVYHRPKYDKWQAKIDFNNKRVYLGCYKTAELASEAYKEAKKKLHKFNPIQR